MQGPFGIRWVMPLGHEDVALVTRSEANSDSRKDRKSGCFDNLATHAAVSSKVLAN